MGVDLARHLLLGATSPERVDEPEQELAQAPHGQPSSSRSASTNPASRRQRFVWRSSARPPARDHAGWIDAAAGGVASHSLN
jgi:hypothetical protein